MERQLYIISRTIDAILSFDIWFILQNIGAIIAAWFMLSLITGVILPIVAGIIAESKGRKSYLAAYALWFHWWFLGVHRFYAGKAGTGIVWLLTGGLLGIGGFLDFFLTGFMIKEYNDRAQLRREPESTNINVNINGGAGQSPLNFDNQKIVSSPAPKTVHAAQSSSLSSSTPVLDNPRNTEEPKVKCTPEKTILKLLDEHSELEVRELLMQSDLSLEELQETLEQLAGAGVIEKIDTEGSSKRYRDIQQFGSFRDESSGWSRDDDSTINEATPDRTLIRLVERDAAISLKSILLFTNLGLEEAQNTLQLLVDNGLVEKVSADSNLVFYRLPGTDAVLEIYNAADESDASEVEDEEDNPAEETVSSGNTAALGPTVLDDTENEPGKEALAEETVPAAEDMKERRDLQITPVVMISFIVPLLLGLIFAGAQWVAHSDAVDQSGRPVTMKVFHVRTQGLNLRDEPSTTAEIAAVQHKGDILYSIFQDGKTKWWFVANDNGSQRGWISGSSNFVDTGRREVWKGEFEGSVNPGTIRFKAALAPLLILVGLGGAISVYLWKSNALAALPLILVVVGVILGGQAATGAAIHSNFNYVVGKIQQSSLTGKTLSGRDLIAVDRRLNRYKQSAFFQFADKLEEEPFWGAIYRCAGDPDVVWEKQPVRIVVRALDLQEDL